MNLSMTLGKDITLNMDFVLRRKVEYKVELYIYFTSQYFILQASLF